MLKKALGLDFFDLVIHIGVTIALGVVVSSLFPGSREEVGIGLVFATSLLILAGRRQRARARGEMGTGEVESQRVLALEERVAELEHAQSRLLELEERVDFAERLLTRQRDDLRLPG